MTRRLAGEWIVREMWTKQLTPARTGNIIIIILRITKKVGRFVLKILVINAGSSSLKYQLFDMRSGEVLAKGLCERIGIDGKVKHQSVSGAKYEAEAAMHNHSDAIRVLVQMLTEGELAVISGMHEIDAIGHRVVHGAEYFSGSVLIDDKVMRALEDCVSLAPLHNPPNLVGIRACMEIMQGVPQVAVFDTAFHQTMPKHAYLYALPYEYYEKYRVRKYGFHGTSHKYVAGKAAEALGKPLSELKIITCHLGNGSSITAVNGGKSVDTSMGLTPLGGVPMGTRSGEIDPAILEFIMEREGISIDEMTGILNKRSGVLGVSGVSSDFRDLHDAEESGNGRAKVALELFAYGVKRYIGSYMAVMNGADAIVFTAGIGENNRDIRRMVTENLDFLGIAIDQEKNLRNELDISAVGARVRTLVIPTNEELVIAGDTESIAGAL